MCSIYPIVVSNMELDVCSSKSGHPMEGCTLGGAFIWFGQDMQEFGTLSMLRANLLFTKHAQ